MNQTHYLTKILQDLHMLKADSKKSIEISMNEYNDIKSIDSQNTRIDFKGYAHAINKLN